ncbi:MAG: hypothetical protein QOF76_2678 [Solirubrobacteraceae bacterium]|jgi:hypothetical protein|nr:hypothetical protein [Solirubrobacteraceae bacterium]
MFGGKKRKQRLQDAGVDAQAVLTSVQDTGMTINDNPRVKLTLQVTAPDGSAFEVQMKQTVSRVQVPRPGDTFAVRYDPEDPSNFELLGMTGSGGGAVDSGAALEAASAGQIAAAVQQAGASAGVTRGSAAELLASGQRMSAVLTEFSPTGQTVGDQNPAAPDPSDPVYVMKTNLLIDGSTPIEAIFMHRIPQAQVTGLRLGKRLAVAVNPSNPTREVAIDWAGSADTA